MVHMLPFPHIFPRNVDSFSIFLNGLVLIGYNFGLGITAGYHEELVIAK